MQRTRPLKTAHVLRMTGNPETMLPGGQCPDGRPYAQDGSSLANGIHYPSPPLVLRLDSLGVVKYIATLGLHRPGRNDEYRLSQVGPSRLEFRVFCREPIMKGSTIAGGAFATVLVLLALAAGYRALEQDVDPAAATSPAVTAPAAAAAGGGPPELPLRPHHHR